MKEYWYPAIVVKKVGSRPVLAEIVGMELVLFRDGDGALTALANACPHRGACEFADTIA